MKAFASSNRAPAQQAARSTALRALPAPQHNDSSVDVTRRDVLSLATTTAAAAAALFYGIPEHAHAVQGYTAGRIPGVTPDPSRPGYYVYRRPEGKQGGHGIGWSEVPQYSFNLPAGWEEMPVSIADLGGTEIDLRFTNKDQGGLMVIVAPILRFRDVGFNADVRIEQLGPPEQILNGFASELFGRPLEGDDVIDMSTTRTNGLTYYRYEVKPHFLVAATAVKNRVFIITINANGRQWRKAEADLRNIQNSFNVEIPAV